MRSLPNRLTLELNTDCHTEQAAVGEGFLSLPLEDLVLSWFSLSTAASPFILPLFLLWGRGVIHWALLLVPKAATEAVLLLTSFL